MNLLVRTVVRVFSLLLAACGVFFVLDGLLPTKSSVPNPTWPEIFIGCVFLVVGLPLFILVGRQAEREARQRDEEKTDFEHQPGRYR